MPIVLDLDPATEQSLRQEAARKGVAAEQFVSELISRELSRNPVVPDQSTDPRYLMQLSVEERGRILAAAADDAAGDYEADLALSDEDRELTAFTALNDDPLYEYPEHST